MSIKNDVPTYELTQDAVGVCPVGHPMLQDVEFPVFGSLIVSDK